MKVYTANFSEYGSYGWYKEINCVVVANTESEALGMVLTEFPNTTSRYWYLDEVDTNIPNVIHQIMIED